MVASSMAVASTKSTFFHCASSSREFGSNFSSGVPIKSLNFQLKSRRTKARNDICLVVSATGTGKISEESNDVSGGRFYLNFTGFPFPLGPFLNRRTIRTEYLRLSKTAYGYLSKSKHWDSAVFQQTSE
uniref:Uncharacterized protein LOC104232827 isoform X3 n=1 Tax=Nicotiana sylvestris TaxID=4096 RepID=A0A1U7XBU4_NICSY|nr:PREDICTED: uncharacterized protein LOC104232827 isoform X3 [Nicotiana sylvestris]